MSEHEQRKPPSCDLCGVDTDQLDDEGLCSICVEIDARVEAQLMAPMIEYAVHAISVALDYLHPDDVRAIVERDIEERDKSLASGRFKEVCDYAFLLTERRVEREGARPRRSDRPDEHTDAN